MFSLYLYYLRMRLQGRGVGSVKPGGGVGVYSRGTLVDIMAHKGGHLFGRGHLLECELKM